VASRVLLVDALFCVCGREQAQILVWDGDGPKREASAQPFNPDPEKASRGRSRHRIKQ